MTTGKGSPYFATIAWLVMVVSSLIFISQKLHVVSDMQQFMPEKSQDKRLQVLLHESQKGITSNIVLVQINGGSAEYLAEVSHKLKQALKKDHDLFLSVMNGEQDFNIKQFYPLFKYRYILTKPGDFSVKALRENFTNILTLFRSGASGELTHYLLLDPQKIFIKYLLAQTPQVQPIKKHGIWFMPDSSGILLMAQLNSAGFNLDIQQAGINAIRNGIKRIDETGTLKTELSGPGVIAVATRDAIRNTTRMISIILTVVIFILFWFGYRSIRLAIYAGIPLVSSVIFATAITQLIFGSIHGIVIAFGITLLGVCLDYPLHLFSHLRKNEKVNISLKRVLPSLRLGVLTSVLAFLALIGTGFNGLTQLAVFSSVGLIVALAVTQWILPTWLSNVRVNRCTVPVSYPLHTRTKTFISIFVIGVPLIILSLHDKIWSTDISQISPVSPRAGKTDYKLRQALHAVDVNHIFLIEDKSLDEVLINTNKIRSALAPAIDKGLISSVQAVTDLLPDKLSQKQYQALLPGKEELKNNVFKAQEGTGIKKNTFNKFIDAVVSSKTGPLIGYENIAGSPLGFKLKSMLFQYDNKWYSLVRVTGVKNDILFKQWVKASPAVSKDYISVHDSTSTLMNNYLQIAWVRLLGVLSLVMVIVLWLTKQRSETFWLLIPVFSGVLVSLSVQVLLGNLINIFHILSLLLVVGMGFDYSLFFNNDWENEEQLQERTHAIIISAITTIIAFGLLAFSGVPVLSVMGQTVSVGILTCFVVAQRIAVPKQILRN